MWRYFVGNERDVRRDVKELCRRPICEIDDRQQHAVALVKCKDEFRTKALIVGQLINFNINFQVKKNCVLM